MAFYNTARKTGSLGSATLRNQNKGNTQASTPGSFFHARNRNMSACQGGTQQASQVTSMAFDRYLQARERISTKAKEHIDKLNQSAISRVKHQKLSEKY